MKNIKVVIGANFGDEGKGLMTDVFCYRFSKNEPVLNVRFNGTCQAGHTVVKGDKRHVFSHFGSGSFNENVITFLTSDFHINPILFNEEYEKLVNLGVNPKVLVSSNAPIVTFYDILYNRVLENSRGKERHGSCGLGLWESVLRNKANYTFTADNLKYGPLKLSKILLDIRDGYFKEKFKQDNVVFDSSVDDLDWFDEDIIACYIEDCKRMLERIEIVDEKEILNQYSNIVFEGAQGLLLDWNNREYMPYLTASRTGIFNVNRVLHLIEDDFNLEVCYVTRSYFTRHGAGIFKTEVENKEVLGIVENDKTNFLNKWQGQFRYGYFDLELFKKTLLKDLSDLSYHNTIKSICITHLNESNDLILTKNPITLEEFREEMGNDWIIYLSKSEQELKLGKI